MADLRPHLGKMQLKLKAAPPPPLPPSPPRNGTVMRQDFVRLFPIHVCFDRGLRLIHYGYFVKKVFPYIVKNVGSSFEVSFT